MGNKSSSKNSKSQKGGTKMKFGRKTQIPQTKLDRIKITKSLNLEKCKYSSLPHNLFMIDQLEIVNLNDNTIKVIDEEMIPPFEAIHGTAKTQNDEVKEQTKSKKNKKSKYKGIKLLRMSNNRLSSLPDSFANLHNLQTLQLVGNQFVHFPGVLFQLPRLKELSLKNNQIQIIPCTLPIIQGVKRLTELDLSYNRLQTLPDEFTHLKSLQVCNLEHNELKELPVSWAEMKALHIINFKCNHLHHIPKSLFIETNVVRVDMEDNPVYTSKKYVHLEGFEQFSERHKKNWDKGDAMGADRSKHTV
eukprot:48201_1